MVTRYVRRTVEIDFCDYCGKEIDPEEDPESGGGTCSKCGKDVCLDHVGEVTEDLCMCKKCSERYEFDMVPSEIASTTAEKILSTIIVSKKTERRVKMVYP